MHFLPAFSDYFRVFFMTRLTYRAESADIDVLRCICVFDCSTASTRCYVKAMQANSQQEPKLIAVETPEPQPGEGEVLFHVHAAGRMATKRLWYPTTGAKDGAVRTSAVPGHKFSGVIAVLEEDAAKSCAFLTLERQSGSARRSTIPRESGDECT
jgi:hypothetical protein